MPARQAHADVEFVPIWIHNGHAAQAWQILVRGFVHSDALSAKLVEPNINVWHVEVDQAAYRTIARVLSQKERQAVAGHLHKGRKVGFEPVFPINLKTEALDVELLAPRVVSHPQRWHHALLRILITGHRLTPSNAPRKRVTSDAASHC
jgi:hypothetical protein